MARPRIIFFGTPDGVLPVLESLKNSPELKLAAIVTQPQKPKGRGLGMDQSAVGRFAEKHEIPLEAPESLKDEATLERLAQHKGDCFVVFAYGRILPKRILELPRAGVVNVHPSLLPKYRGASPIQAAILSGDTETGVSYIRMNEGMDTGPLLAASRMPIAPIDTAETLFSRAAEQAAVDLPPLLTAFLRNEKIPVAQDEAQATTTAPLTRENGLLDFSGSAEQLSRQVRAYTPWPGSFSFWKGKRIIVTRAEALGSATGEPGVVLVEKDFPAVQTGKGLLVLHELQLEGKPRSAGDAFLRGYQSFPGSRLGA